MPAATTHYEFSKDVYLSLDAKHADMITNLNMFYLGSQGPDLFFFNEAGITSKSLKKLGNRMHDEKIKEVINFLYQYSKDDNDLLSYTYGYLCHYALDTVVHPLVYYAQRHIMSNLEDEMINHFRIEATYDKELLAYKGKDINDYDVYDALCISDTDSVKLASMYQKLFKEVFDLNVSFKRIQNTCKDCAFFLKLLKPNNIKYQAVTTIENIFRAPHFVSGLMLNNNVQEDVLNLNRIECTNIYEEEHQFNDTFFELYDKAKTKACRLINDPTNEQLTNLTFNGASIQKAVNI